MSDCSAVANMQTNAMHLTAEGAAARALTAGLDVYGGWNDDLWGDGSLEAAIRAGLADEKTLDEAVRRTTLQKLKLGLFDAATPWDDLGENDVDAPEARAAAFDAALQGVVLLQNDGDALPLLNGFARGAEREGSRRRRGADVRDRGASGGARDLRRRGAGGAHARAVTPRNSRRRRGAR